jgi:hypothetical protein
VSAFARKQPRCNWFRSQISNFCDVMRGFFAVVADVLARLCWCRVLQALGFDCERHSWADGRDGTDGERQSGRKAESSRAEQSRAEQSCEPQQNRRAAAEQGGAGTEQRGGGQRTRKRTQAQPTQPLAPRLWTAAAGNCRGCSAASLPSAPVPVPVHTTQ